jgi:hypothetical protein
MALEAYRLSSAGQQGQIDKLFGEPASTRKFNLKPHPGSASAAPLSAVSLSLGRKNGPHP